MPLPLKPVCKKALIRRDGTTIIFIPYCHSLKKRTLLHWHSHSAQFWSLKRLRINPELPTSYGCVELLNEQLKGSIRIAEDILAFAAKKKIEDPLLFLKRTFMPDLDLSTLDEKVKQTELPKINLDVYFQIDGAKREFELFRELKPIRPVFILKTTGDASKILADKFVTCCLL
jgi:hypothetical protein